jgi:hypothetical protein
MKKSYLASTVALLCAPVLVHAADPVITPGKGAEYIARITFDKDTLKEGGKSVEITTGQPVAEPHYTAVIPAVKSMGWNDHVLNPKKCSATVTANCMSAVFTTDDLADKAYGWSHNSLWYLVDLTALKGKKAHVHIKVERYQDDQLGGEPGKDKDGNDIILPSDDDLIPAMTVWKGMQITGTKTHWYPNRHQGAVADDGSDIYFWANDLQKPQWRKTNTTNYELRGTTSAALGYDTAFDSSGKTVAEVQGEIKLDSKDMTANYLSIALGGDDREPGRKRDVNYKLTISVHL